MTMQEQPAFPKPFRYNGRLFWKRSDIEAFKRRLIAVSLGVASDEADRPKPEFETFVGADELAKEFSVTRRTIGRWIEGLDAGAASEPKAA